ncbi:MAG TPA: HEAT repeat domain-containing protein [Ktedonobacterales bacterium]|nr:HEAT repeat domain-containing protein [Ktedonobacterales bacterium]
MAKGERMSDGPSGERATRGATGKAGRAGHPVSPQAKPTHSAHVDASAHASSPVPLGYLGASAAPITVPTWKRRLYIDRPADLRAIAGEIATTAVLAIDAEFAQTRIRAADEPAHRLALLQLACDNDQRASYVIDALRLADLSPLLPAFENPSTLKLFHGISADARVLAARGLEARGTLDLEAVSRSIFGQRETGLQKMLQRAGGVRLDKSLQRADWSRRPLTPAMVAYAARDAEMTLVLYGWLRDNYPWAVALHETPADEPPPDVADWILPYLEGARPRPVALAVAEAGLANNLPRQLDDVRAALLAVRHPNQRARVMRVITDLELARLAPDLRPYITAEASEERAGAIRAIGRLHDRAALPLIEPLLDDPVQDVRQAAFLAVEQLSGAATRRPRRAQPAGPVKWSSVVSEEESGDANDWRAKLRAKFGGGGEG